MIIIVLSWLVISASYFSYLLVISATFTCMVILPVLILKLQWVATNQIA